MATTISPRLLNSSSRARQQFLRRAGPPLELGKTQTQECITADTNLSVSVRTALQATARYMTALYDPTTPESRLYLEARPDLTPAA